MSKKIGLLIIFLIVIGIIIIKLSVRDYHGPKSNHFDGRNFFNSTVYKKNTFLDIIKWSRTSTKKQWPTNLPSEPQPPIEAVKKPGEVKITFVNHATVLIQTQHFTVLTDPIWDKVAGPFSWLGAPRARAPGVEFKDLPHIDAVIISHNHYDHMSFNTLKRLEQRFHPLLIVPLGLKTTFKRAGFKHVQELDWWQTISVKDAKITFLPAVHWSGRGIFDHFHSLWGSYGIEVGNKKIYFAGDSGYGPHYRLISEKWGKPDLALLPIGAYLPDWFMRSSHLNPNDAVLAHQELKARYSMGIHFGTFQLSDESIEQPVIDLNKARIKANISDKTFFVLPQGGNWILP